MAQSVTAYQFQAPGIVATSALLGSQNGPITVSDGGVYLLRFMIQGSGASTPMSKPAAVQYSVDGGAFVGATTATPVRAAENTADARLDGSSTSRLTGGTGAHVGTYIPTVNTLGTGNSFFNQDPYPANTYTECVWSFRLNPADFNGTGVVTLEIANAGTMDVTPTINYEFPLNRRIVIV